MATNITSNNCKLRLGKSVNFSSIRPNSEGLFSIGQHSEGLFSIGQHSEGLFNIWQNFEPSLVNILCYVLIRFTM